MDDDEARKFALDSAAVFMRGAPFTEVLEAARAFHAFLVEGPTMSAKGADALKRHVDEIQSEQCIPPPLPAQYDLARADQSPLLEAFRRSVEQLDASDTPTRIVRTQAEVE